MQNYPRFPVDQPGMQLPPGAPGHLDPCWNKIGVYGDHTCPELPHFVHCRNCPVHSKAGVQFLNRSIPAGYRREWTDHFAREKSPAVLGRVSALLFRVGMEWLALP